MRTAQPRSDQASPVVPNSGGLGCSRCGAVTRPIALIRPVITSYSIHYTKLYDLKEIAPDFPNTSFAWGTAGDTFDIPNIFAYEAYSQEGGYVNGVMAAALSTSDTIGVVGPIEVGDAKVYVDGFIAGAKATKPDIKVNVIV